MTNHIYGTAGPRNYSDPRRLNRQPNEWAKSAIACLCFGLEKRFPLSTILFIGNIKVEQEKAAPAMKFYTKPDVDVVEVLKDLLKRRVEVLKRG
jgi:hypothetical protein